MNEKDLTEKMESLGIRPTAVRLMIGRVLDATDHPVSALEIEMELDTVDRSTITRSLSLFHDKGLIHLIEDGSGAAKFELCDSSHDAEDSDMHVHFHCRKCGRTVCLHSVQVPSIELPPNFFGESSNFTVTGLCDHCNNANNL
ncbi:MAG: transcriptional repressor [Muribaculaceae bacterium]|nr:transcriptional repressor [Muribaculaceae bacterium]